MWMTRIAAFAFAALAPAAPVLAEGIAITHSPAGCVPSDRYLRVTARAAPADAAASAELQFRGGSDGDWYVARMARVDGTWSAFLPRTRRGTTRVEYRIVMTGADTGTSATPVHGLAVDARCSDADAAVEVAAPIVVRVPAGAPPVPPVPPGFSPAGVVAEEPPSKSRRTLALVSGAAVAGVAIAAATGRGPAPQSVARDIPEFRFLGTRPDPGAVISLASQDMQLLVAMSQPRRPLTLNWQAEFFSATPGCQILMFGSIRDAFSPLEMVLAGPLIASMICGPEVRTERARIRVWTNGPTVWDETLTLPFTFRR